MKAIKWIVLVLILVPYLTILVFLLSASIADGIMDARRDKLGTDQSKLRSVIAEAYIRMKQDPSFVNTATGDEPVEVPEKYYTYIESAQGHGRVHVVVYADGDVSAYFGTPEKTLKYYLYGEGSHVFLRCPFLSSVRREYLNFWENYGRYTRSPFACMLDVLAIGAGVCWVGYLVKMAKSAATPDSHAD